MDGARCRLLLHHEVAERLGAERPAHRRSGEATTAMPVRSIAELGRLD